MLSNYQTWTLSDTSRPCKCIQVHNAWNGISALQGLTGGQSVSTVSFLKVLIFRTIRGLPWIAWVWSSDCFM